MQKLRLKYGKRENNQEFNLKKMKAKEKKMSEKWKE